MNARGLHHVTAIIGDVQRAADFYAGVLGLRRIKKTVCYDDPPAVTMCTMATTSAIRAP
ncbi:VOC family protein [Bradyrhizobium elkanii]|uniref:VOC family protein n=1 Tax=Bradyrhizobium elkanii TaxID=29448 RepID=UPI0035164F93